MKTVSARQANHDFSELLSRVERGEEILITRRPPIAIPTFTFAVMNGGHEIVERSRPALLDSKS
jgi:hypothetical protein